MLNSNSLTCLEPQRCVIKHYRTRFVTVTSSPRGRPALPCHYTFVSNCKRCVPHANVAK